MLFWLLLFFLLSTGVPHDCHEAKFVYKHDTTNNVFNIDPDGPEGSNPPFLAYCINTVYRHVGVTVIPTNGSTVNPGPGNPVKYPVEGTLIPPLKDRSGFCMQELSYTCQVEYLFCNAVEM